jgi:hypothetical protein
VRRNSDACAALYAANATTATDLSPTEWRERQSSAAQRPTRNPAPGGCPGCCVRCNASFGGTGDALRAGVPRHAPAPCSDGRSLLVISSQLSSNERTRSMQ